jgi:pheromone shutdown protein TraB
MSNVTLIGTFHSEYGLCNSDELYKILENIKPEVIFHELPTHLSEFCYSEKFDILFTQKQLIALMTLEMKCIKRYKQNYDITIAPIDIDTIQKDEEINYMLKAFSKDENYINIENEQKALTKQEGFYFLNSNKYLELEKKKELLEKDILESDNHKNNLQKIYKRFQTEQHDKRENAMIQNIYNYSRENPYKQAVFLIGAGHLKTIMIKIDEHRTSSKIQLNWTMYNNE